MACVPPPAPPPPPPGGSETTTTTIAGSTVERATTTTAVPAPLPGPGRCPVWQASSPPTVAAPGLIETSGLAGGQANPGVWWTHNDSGDTARVFALEGDGRLLTTVTVLGASAWDWEDMDIGPGPGGRPYLWVADLGDNGKARHGGVGYQLYRFAEPSLGVHVPTSMSVAAERIDVVYPDGRSHNVEATILDPVTGDYFIITKERRSTIFRIPAASLVPGTTVVPANVGEMMLDDPNSTHDRPVAADISTDGSMIVVKNMELTYYWHRAPGQSVGAALSSTSPCPFERLGSGEAIAFNASNGHLATLAEGHGRPLKRFIRL